MNENELLAARRTAERAVSDMPDGELKIKAFEVVFQRLLDADNGEHPSYATGRKRPVLRDGKNHSADSIPGRILTLQQEGFFVEQRSIAEIKDELDNHGWHIPTTSLSGRLQTLVQQRKLRRERATVGTKRVWKYSNH